MLVLSRKKNEEIKIGKDITITVVEVQPNRVRLGITAPKNVEIVRSELINWRNEDGQTLAQEAEQKNTSEEETVDVDLKALMNQQPVGSDDETVDADSLGGIILDKELTAQIKALKKANEDSSKSTEQSAPATS